MSRLVAVRMEDADVARLSALQERLQSRAEPHTYITQRVVVLRALDALEAQLDKLDRDRERKR